MENSTKFFQSDTIRQSSISMLRFGGIIVVAFLLGIIMAYLPLKSYVLLIVSLLLPILAMKPEKLLLFYLASSTAIDQAIPFLTMRILGIRFGPNIMIRGALIIIMIMYMIINKRFPLEYRPSVPILFMIVLTTVSTLFGGFKTLLGLIDLNKILFWALLMIVVYDMVKLGKINIRHIYLCIAISIFVAVSSVIVSDYYNLVNLPTYINQGVENITGAFESPHSLTISLAMGIAVVLTSVIKQKKFINTTFMILFLFAIIITIIRAYVRTGYTSLFSAFFVFNVLFWTHSKSKGNKRQRLVMLFILSVLILFSSYYFSTKMEMIEKRFSDFHHEDPEMAGGGRVKIFRTCIEIYKSYNPIEKIIGCGFGSGYSVFGYLATHNDYLYFLLSGGVLGLVLILWILVSAWKQMKPRHDDYFPYIIGSCAIVVYLVASLTNNVATYPTVMTYLSFAVGGAGGYYHRVTSNEK